MTRAGTPATTAPAGTSSTHTAPAATTAPFAYAHAFQDHGVGADHDIVLDDDGRGACGFNDACQHGSSADVAVLAHGGAAAQHGAHVDHGALTDDGADIDDGTHHDDGTVADLDAVADDRARLDAGIDALKVEHRDGGVAAVILDVVVVDGVGIGIEDGLELIPVAKDGLATTAAVGDAHRPTGPSCPAFRARTV